MNGFIRAGVNTRNRYRLVDIIKNKNALEHFISQTPYYTINFITFLSVYFVQNDSYEIRPHLFNKCVVFEHSKLEQLAHSYLNAILLCEKFNVIRPIISQMILDYM